MKTANEIALEAKVQEMEKEITLLKDFEREVITSFAMVMMGTVVKDDSLSVKGLDKLKDVVATRARVKAQQMGF